uniref:Uncharacterized protein n=1 Tax=Anguilla anguilla TaxID=7936 RepID=A0A0E9VFS1_ANGAN
MKTRVHTLQKDSLSCGVFTAEVKSSLLFLCKRHKYWKAL